MVNVKKDVKILIGAYNVKSNVQLIAITSNVTKPMDNVRNVKVIQLMELIVIKFVLLIV